MDDPSASQFLRDNAPVRPTLNRHVAEAAPSVKCSPFMMNNTSPMCACSMPRRKEPTGVRSRGSSWTSTLSGSLIGRAFDNHLKRAKWAAHIGYGNCFVEGGPGAIKIGGSPPQIFSAPLRHRWCGTPRSCSGIGLLNVRDVNPYLIRRGLIDLDVEDEAISLRAGGLHTGPSLALHWRV